MMLEGARMILESRYTSVISIDNNLIFIANGGLLKFSPSLREWKSGPT